MPKADNRIQLVVVVSGVARPAQVNIHEPLQNLVRDVLRDSGDAGRSLEDFELRAEDGRILDLHANAGDSGLQDGDTLFVNPRAGAGG